VAHIAVRVDESEAWQFVEGTPYPNEAFLRDSLYEEPKLIPARDLGLNPEAAIVTLREVGLPRSGSSDVVLIYSDGQIVVVECKLASNPEKKRAVIGQVLDYASSFKTLSYDDLDKRVHRVHTRPLNEVMREKVKDDLWNEERFVDDVSETLAAGGIGLVIAIDEMDPDLERIVRYISDRSGGSLRIFGLEMRYHRQGTVEVIIPHIANPIGTGEAETRWRLWNPEQFRKDLSRINDERTRAAAEDILDFALKNPDELYWGRAQGYGSFGYPVTVGGTKISLFTYYTGGTLLLNLETLKSKAADRVFERFVESIAALRGFERLTNDAGGSPQFQTRDTLANESVRTAFKKAVLAIQGGISDTRES
jgi:hypothetical protein